MSAVATVEKSGKGARYSGHYEFVKDPKGDDENADDSDLSTEETKASVPNAAVAEKAAGAGNDRLAAVSLQRLSQDLLNEAEVLELRRMTERGMSAATVEKSRKGAKYSGHYEFVKDPNGDDENGDDSDLSTEETKASIPNAAIAEKAAGAGSDRLAAVSLQRLSQDLLNEAEVLELRRMTERGMSAVATVEKSGKGAKYSGHYKFVQDPKGDDENADDSDFNTEETKAPLLKTAVAATVGPMASDHEGDGKGNAKDGEGKDDSKGGEGKFEDKGVEKRGSGMGQ